MAGIALVGLSGSLIQDTAKQSLFDNILSLRILEEKPTDAPEATTVLLGKLTSNRMISIQLDRALQACSSFYLLRSCKSCTYSISVLLPPNLVYIAPLPNSFSKRKLWVDMLSLLWSQSAWRASSGLLPFSSSSQFYLFPP